MRKGYASYKKGESEMHTYTRCCTFCVCVWKCCLGKYLFIRGINAWRKILCVFERKIFRVVVFGVCFPGAYKRIIHCKWKDKRFENFYSYTTQAYRQVNFARDYCKLGYIYTKLYLYDSVCVFFFLFALRKTIIKELQSNLAELAPQRVHGIIFFFLSIPIFLLHLVQEQQQIYSCVSACIRIHMYIEKVNQNEIL